jgi:Transposase/DDE superfamily endonuclease
MPFGELGKLVEPKVSASTVQRVLNAAGYHRRKARKVIYLKPEQKAARLQWAKDFRHWKLEDWARVLYSDEAYVVLGESKGTVYVTRTVDKVFHDDCVVPKYKQSGLRVMVWGCIMEGVKGPLVILEYPGGRGGGMTAARYQDQVLDKVVHDFYQKMCEERGQVLFQQDSASSHTVKSTTAWLDRNSVERIRHPAASPDVNPIEPVWHDLKEFIRAREHIPTTLEELKEAVKEAWDQVPIAKVNKYVLSMEDRVRAVIKAKGGHTPF